MKDYVTYVLIGILFISNIAIVSCTTGDDGLNIVLDQYAADKYADLDYTKRCTVTPTRQYYLDQINAIRRSGTYCGNKWYHPVRQLSYDCNGEPSALIHAKDMLDNQYFDHTGTDGSNAGDRLEMTDVWVRSWWEILAMNYINLDDAIQAWLDSPGHCEAIMASNVNKISLVYLGGGNGRVKRVWVSVLYKTYEDYRKEIVF